MTQVQLQQLNKNLTVLTKEVSALRHALREASPFIWPLPVNEEAPRRMTKRLEKLVAKAESDFKAGKNISGPFSTSEEVAEYFKSLA